jgi:hypothetical protein
LITPERDHRGRQLAARASDGPSSDMDEDPPSDPPDTPPALDPLEVEDVVGSLLGSDPGGHPITSWSDCLPSLPPCISSPIGRVFLAINIDSDPRGLAQVVVIPVTRELKPMGRARLSS